MSKLSSDVFIGSSYNRPSLSQMMRKVDEQVNGLSEGRIKATYAAQTAAPTTGSYAVGDKIWNSNPAELGTVGGKYIVLGWICTVAGEPGTLKEMRVLTGG